MLAEWTGYVRVNVKIRQMEIKIEARKLKLTIYNLSSYNI